MRNYIQDKIKDIDIKEWHKLHNGECFIESIQPFVSPFLNTFTTVAEKLVNLYAILRYLSEK
jgi:hypothetical protein